MSTLAQLRDGIQARLATVTSLHAFDVWPNSINQFPAIVVMPSAMSSKTAMGAGRRVLTFELTLIAGSAEKDAKRAQDMLDVYLDETGTSSILAALEADKTLGGTATTIDVSWRGYAELLDLGGIKFLTAVFDLTIWP